MTWASASRQATHFSIADFTQRLRLWATIACIATIIASGFGIILLALDAKAVQDGTAFGHLVHAKAQILAAQLAFALMALLLCLAFIAIYIAVRSLASRPLRQPHLRGSR